MSMFHLLLLVTLVLLTAIAFAAPNGLVPPGFPTLPDGQTTETNTTQLETRSIARSCIPVSVESYGQVQVPVWCWKPTQIDGSKSTEPCIFVEMKGPNGIRGITCWNSKNAGTR